MINNNILRLYFSKKNKWCGNIVSWMYSNKNNINSLLLLIVIMILGFEDVMNWVIGSWIFSN